MKPLVGVSCCSKPFGIYAAPNHATSDTNVRVVCELVEGVPVLLPACGKASDASVLLDRLDGLLLTGSRSNVQPGLYGGPPHPDGTPEDPQRDSATLPLIRRAVAAGLPVLAICRGMQELNVALGGSLHQRLQDLPGRLDHSTPLQASEAIRIGKAHAIRLAEGSWLARLAESATPAVNSLHNQGVDRLAAPLRAVAWAPDDTIEAAVAPGAPGFVLGVQWHPEHDWRTDLFSRRIFQAFGAAMRARIAAGQHGSLAAAAD